jgi:hypothetical protein
MSKKLLMGLVSVLAVAAFAVPAVAQAAPQFRVNGVLAETAKQNVTEYGTLTLTNQLVGEFKCKIVAGVPVWNEGEKGVTAFEGWEPYLCKAPECVGQAFVTAENAVELIEKINSKSEKEYTAKRGTSTLPWPGETFTPETGKSAVKLRKMKLFLDCPSEGLELPFTGFLEPRVTNGIKNGLFTSHLVFEGKGGKTSFLTSPLIDGGNEVPESELFFSGELAMLGTSQQLITLE